ncbi:hypothetical protein B0O99DRAFT_595937 [Bisporella sp. PMI_857]|nr:hypothetical protein B0O99DRAFT_595937 [Bisporella sp. PMI_857]
MEPRKLLSFPPGDNSSDTLIEGIHYNLTNLKYFNYTFYSNRTFSNGSRCVLVFEPYTPLRLLENGTFLNSTSCYSPIKPIKVRAVLGLVYASLFALGIVFTLINLRKHGRLFLPTEMRFRAVGRRWQWYWMLAVGAFGIISGITGVDIDRYYLPHLPIILSNFFWFLMLPCTMAVVWESVRHWGSWQERQLIDPEPFMLRQDDRRSKVEFFIPLVFYLCFWMNFFMVFPRSWASIEMQRDPIQARNYAEISATDIRFKLAAVFLLLGWLTTIYSLCHSIKHYKLRNHGIKNRTFGLLKYTPKKFLMTLPLSLVMIGYEAACAFEFSISPLKLQPYLGFVYGLGWGSITCILIIYIVAGYLDPNEDRELIRQRRIRGAEVDAEMLIKKKPLWWTLLRREEASMQAAIARNAREIGGGSATSRNIERAIEMASISPVVNEDEHRRLERNLGSLRTASSLLFPATTSNALHGSFKDPPRGQDVETTPSNASLSPTLTSPRSGSTSSGVSIDPRSQQIHSMLDV